MHPAQFGNARWGSARWILAWAIGVWLVCLTVPTALADACIAAPERPRLDSPLPRATVNTNRVGLNWRAANCADTYAVVVRQDIWFGRPVDAKYNLTALTYNTRWLDKGHTYWWMVEACNASGCTASRWGKFNLR